MTGAAPAVLSGLATPAAIFVGGGAGDAGVLDAASHALRPAGRLVVNAVTLDTEAVLLARHAALFVTDETPGGQAKPRSSRSR